jgi:hypothetical protein
MGEAADGSMTIVSKAQHEMFTRAASDPDYAKLRGISPDLARAKLQAHADAGSPELRDRAAEKGKRSAPATKTDAGAGLLGYR